MDATADYVVARAGAGAGSAGCVLAKRLAGSGASVILLRRAGLIAPGWCASVYHAVAPAMMIGEHCAKIMLDG